ncbi:MAG: aph [Proteobacteria bacterium]|nr:aph [Pseudomonadota bacterium]
MLTQAAVKTIEHAIGQAAGNPFVAHQTSSMGGGCINSAYRLEGDGRSYFVKVNRSELLPMFEAEAEGLREIVATQTVNAPEPVCHGIAGDQSYLVMECLDLHSARGSVGRLLGDQLAAMHRIKQPFFGWHRDNTIGSTPQPNARSDDWADFWAGQRLGFQLDLAAHGGYRGRLQRSGEKLREHLPALFDGYRPQPSLLHGDLWGGNWAAIGNGQPAIFDPACYYGDREADIAMTELFGGFGGDFYAAYRETLPLDAGYGVRKVLYNLYHILNHLNLFGGGYLGQAESMIDRLLAEVR